MAFAGHVLSETGSLFLQMAPYLLLGFLVSGLLYAYLPKDALVRHLGKPGLVPVLKAALFGVPLPLCSCGVIPAALSLRKAGASRGATVSFLVSTPQTGVDSILATYSLMGGFLALMRPLFSTLTAVVAGALANLFGSDKPDPPCDPEPHDHPEHAPPPFFHAPGRFRKAISYGLRDHLSGVYRWLVFGLVLAGVVSACLTSKVPFGEIPDRDYERSGLPFDSLGIEAANLLSPEPGSLRRFLIGNNELLCMLLMVAVGAPLYICATGSIPIAMSFMQAGLSPGAAFVFLMVGPATNVTTMVMSWRYLGRRSTLAYLGAVVGVGLLSGYAINHLAPHGGLLSKSAPALHGESHGAGEILSWISALAMAGAIAAAAWVDIKMAWRARFGGPDTHRSLTLPVEGMTCGHCKVTVETALKALPGVARAEANVSANRVELVLGKGAPPLSRIRQAIEEAGYEMPGADPRP